MSWRNILRLYRVRVRARAVQECFAVLGIAAGVALLFASQVASESLTSSVGELSHGIVGRASLQLLARDPHGMPEALVRQVRAIRGVRVPRRCWKPRRRRAARGVWRRCSWWARTRV